MEALQIRMTVEWTDISGIVNSICDMAETFVVFHHTKESNRPHYHIYLFKLSRKEDTIRNTIKKFNWPQKEDWCVRNYAKVKGKKEKITIEGALKYGSKGMYDPFMIKNIPADHVALGKMLGYVKTEEEPAAVNLMKKLTRLDLVGHIDDEIKSHPDYKESRTYSYSWYLDRVATVCVRERQPLGMFKAIELYEIWKMYHQRPQWIADASNILDRRYAQR